MGFGARANPVPDPKRVESGAIALRSGGRMRYEQVLVDVDGPIATIVLNRPERLNAWTPVMESEVTQALVEAGQATSVRAVVITGAGRGFCSGADLSGGPGAQAAPARGRPGPDRFDFLWNCDKPLVAAVNGPAAGVGLSIALHCDLRYIAEGASVTTAFARRGLIAEHGSAWLLPRLIGLQDATDLLISARKVAADEASRMGLARLLPADGFLAAVQRLTADLVGESSPRSMRVIRRQLRAGLMQSYAEAQVQAHTEQLASLQSADFREGVAAFRERRAAAFTGE
jgi:enoyl-CoA hydratase/carnithine racemase